MCHWTSVTKLVHKESPVYSPMPIILLLHLPHRAVCCPFSFYSSFHTVPSTFHLPLYYVHCDGRTICCPSEGLVCLVGLCYIRLGIIGHSCHFVHFFPDVWYSCHCMGVCFFLFLLIFSTVCGIKNSKFSGMCRHCSTSQCIKDSFSASWSSQQLAAHLVT